MKFEDEFVGVKIEFGEYVVLIDFEWGFFSVVVECVYCSFFFRFFLFW